ncbi:MAG: hypothetical protein Q9207_007495 [Kuettlingeria erythrocarpa]
MLSSRFGSFQLNPIDYYMRDSRIVIKHYPTFVGSDIDGIIMSTGSFDNNAKEVFDYRDVNVVEKIVKAAEEIGVTVQYAFDAVGQVQLFLDGVK